MSGAPWSDSEFNENFYKKAEDYWKSIPASLNGVLGGYGYVTNVDTNMSMRFLKSLDVHKGTALDCGAGIGRITKRLLVPLFEKVDMIDVCENFIEKARSYVDSSKVEHYFVAGLQDFTPEKDRYDVIWMQWISSHLSDTDLLDFFERCFANLRSHGLIVLKENLSSKDYEVDAEDSSVTRSEHKYRELFAKAGLEIVKEEKQADFPTQLYDVKAFALRKRQ